MESIKVKGQSKHETMLIKGRSLVIEKKRSEETHPISNIIKFTLNEKMECIEFGSGQSSEGLFGLGPTTTVFYFREEELENARLIRDYVASYKEEQNSNSQTQGVVSVVEEIKGLKGLLDDGILTQEEFDAKKTQLLSL